jgi:hypothetical protein
MFIFIYGAMGPLTGNVIKGFGRKKKPSNGLKFFQNVKKEWFPGLLLPLSVLGKESGLLKKWCKTLQLSNQSLLVFLNLSKLEIWKLSFRVLILNHLRFVEFLGNLLMKSHRFRIKGARLLKCMGKLNGFLFSSVLKVLLLPKVPILLRLPRLIPFLERLTGTGAWGAVLGVLI